MGGLGVDKRKPLAWCLLAPPECLLSACCRRQHADATWTLPPHPPRALEAAVYEEAGHEEECRREHVMRALLHMDQDMSEKAAQQVGAGWGRRRGAACTVIAANQQTAPVEMRMCAR